MIDYSGLILGLVPIEVASSARDGEQDIEISCAYELGRFTGHDSRTHGPHEFERMSNQHCKSGHERNDVMIPIIAVS